MEQGFPSPEVSALADLADALKDVLTIENKASAYTLHADVNVAEVLLQGLQSITSALRHLGLADAGTPMGAMEVLSMEMKAGSERIAEGLQAIAQAIREGL